MRRSRRRILKAASLGPVYYMRAGASVTHVLAIREGRIGEQPYFDIPTYKGDLSMRRAYGNADTRHRKACYVAAREIGVWIRGLTSELRAMLRAQSSAFFFFFLAFFFFAFFAAFFAAASASSFAAALAAVIHETDRQRGIRERTSAYSTYV